MKNTQYDWQPIELANYLQRLTEIDSFLSRLTILEEKMKSK